VIRVSHDEWRDLPAGDFASVTCEVCGLVEFMVSAECFDREDFAALVAESGWSIERGAVTCPDCVEDQLRPRRRP
jgi:ribosomal protein S27E